MKVRILLFALDELRRRYRRFETAGADSRLDTAPFRAFREALFAAAACAADRPAELRIWWEGTFNGYFLAVSVSPPEALAGLDLTDVCEVEEERIAPQREDGYPFARVAPGRAEPAPDRDGALIEAPFGTPAGHFGAPGMRRIR